jgi:hypothetical protein
MSEAVPELSIGQVAERTGLSVHALRFYEREGIFANAVRRGPDGRRHTRITSPSTANRSDTTRPAGSASGTGRGHTYSDTKASMWLIHIADLGRHVDAGDAMTIVGRL